MTSLPTIRPVSGNVWRKSRSNCIYLMTKICCLLLPVWVAPALSVTLLTEHDLASDVMRGDSGLAQVTWDGRFVLVESDSPDLTNANANSDSQTALIVYDRWQQQVTRIDALHQAGDKPTIRFGRQGYFEISQNGRYVFGVRQNDFLASALRYDRSTKMLTTLAKRVGEGTNSFNYLGYYRPSISMTGLQAVFAAVHVGIGVLPTRSIVIDTPEQSAIVRGSGVFGLEDFGAPGESIHSVSEDGQFLFLRDATGVNIRRSVRDGNNAQVGRGAIHPSADGQIVYLFEISRSPNRIVMVEPGTQRFQFVAQGNLSQVAATLDGQSVFYLLDQSLFMWKRESRRATLVKENVSGNLSVSPDGSVLGLLTDRQTLTIIDREGNTLSSVSSLPGSSIDFFLASNSGIAFTAIGPVEGNLEIPTGEQNVFFHQAGLQPNPSGIQMVVEEPQQASVASGIRTIRGWALGEDDPVKAVSLNIDGAAYGNLPLGGPRDDVGDAFPQVPNAETSGFSAAFGFNGLSAGYHQMTITATTESGEKLSQFVDFVTEPVASEFLSAPGSVTLSSAFSEVDGEGLVVRNVIVDGTSMDVVLKWQTASQSFELIEVSRPR